MTAAELQELVLHSTEAEARAAGIADPWLVTDQRTGSPTFGLTGYMADPR